LRGEFDAMRGVLCFAASLVLRGELIES
ncbi:MAG: hypothetical protein RL069_2352, partial [Planctomycetota bacterium]